MEGFCSPCRPDVITLLMAENLRTGFVWDTFMKTPEARRGEMPPFEFEKGRLIQVLEVNRNLEISALLTKLLEEVNQFSAGKQSDDVTAIVARVR
jgi:hypothetical protein